MAASRQTIPYLQSVLKTLPKVDFAFGYGSGVFKQTGYDDKLSDSSNPSKLPTPMIDFIVGVNDPCEWHKQNLKLNSKHYAYLMRTLGPSAISWVQDQGQRVYYHPYVPIDPSIRSCNHDSIPMMKYGVMSNDAILEDLIHWKSLFISGRLHKPVKHVIEKEAAFDSTVNKNISPSNALSLPDKNGVYRNVTIEDIRYRNDKCALYAALLLLPEHFTEEQLYVTIAGLSYMSDLRFKFGAEAPDKVTAIVQGNIDGFRLKYASVINETKSVDFSSLVSDSRDSSETMIKEVSVLSHSEMLNPLPVRERKCNINESSNVSSFKGYHPEDEKLFESVNEDWCVKATREDISRVTTTAIGNILRKGQLQQYAKGIISAGIVRSSKYFLAKLAKGRKK